MSHLQPSPAGLEEGLARSLRSDLTARILELVVEGFEAWKGEGFPRFRDEEVPYTAVLIGYMMKVARAKSLPYIPKPEVVSYDPEVLAGRADPTQSPRIDIAVSWEASIHDGHYFTIECKRLAPGTLAKLYVNQGMIRFIRGSYAPDATDGGMVGYVIGGDPTTLSSDVNAEVNADTQIGSTHQLGPCSGIGFLSTVCESIHDRRPTYSLIRLTHLFFDMRMLPGKPFGLPRSRKRKGRPTRVALPAATGVDRRDDSTPTP